MGIPFPPLSNGPLLIDQWPSNYPCPIRSRFSPNRRHKLCRRDRPNRFQWIERCSDQLAAFCRNSSRRRSATRSTPLAGANDILNGAVRLAAGNISTIFLASRWRGQYFLGSICRSGNAACRGASNNPGQSASAALTAELDRDLGKLHPLGINVTASTCNALHADSCQSRRLRFSNVTGPAKGKQIPTPSFLGRRASDHSPARLVANLASPISRSRTRQRRLSPRSGFLVCAVEGVPGKRDRAAILARMLEPIRLFLPASVPESARPIRSR